MELKYVMVGAVLNSTCALGLGIVLGLLGFFIGGMLGAFFIPLLTKIEMNEALKYGGLCGLISGFVIGFMLLIVGSLSSFVLALLGITITSCIGGLIGQLLWGSTHNN